MDTFEERPSTKRPASIQALHALALAVAVFLALVATITLVCLFNEGRRMEESHVRYEQCREAAQDLMVASDYLTAQVRLYVLSGDETYLNGYLNEVFYDKNRDSAVKTIHSHLKNDEARERLDAAFGESRNLSKDEMYAMKLVALATGMQQMPQELADVMVSEEDAALDPERMRERANTMVLGEEYQANKNRIVQNVNECTTDLIVTLQNEEKQSNMRFDVLLVVLLVIVILLVAIVALSFLANYVLVIKPVRMHEQAIRDNNPLLLQGSKELRSFADSYNHMYEENHRRTMLLKHEAETDPLTGLFNRGSYARLIEDTGDDIALVLIDVDLFKSVNDTYGHDMGDKVLKNVATIIADNFRTTDFACRIGGDEFAVIMTDMDGVSHAVVERKLRSIAADLHASGVKLPTVTLSSGIAFKSEIEPGSDIYRAADKALYQAKFRGRNCYAFYAAEPE